MGLFNTTHIIKKETSVPYAKEVNINVTEKRAATDESVKLLNEFKEKARGDIMDSLMIDDNLVKGAALCYRHEQTMHTIEYWIEFYINGKQVRIHEQMDKRKINDVRGDLVRFFYEEFSKALTVELMKQSEFNPH